MVNIDVLSVLKSAISQSMGAEYLDGSEIGGKLDVLSSDKIIDIGKDVLDGGSTETFYKSVLSVISEIVVDARAYSGDLNVFMVKDNEWGGFIERIKVGLGTIVSDPKWNLAANAALNPAKIDYSSEELSYYPIPVSAKIFEEGKAIMCPVSKPVDQLKEAFLGVEQMTKFMSAIAQAVENTLNLGLTSFRHMMAQDAIALSVGSGTAVHLLTEAIAEGILENGTTANEAMQDPEFLTFAAERIAEVRDNVKVLSSAYIPNGDTWFSPDGYDKLVLLSKFARRVKFGVKANTFNKDEIGFGEYTTTPAWQGIYTQTREQKFNFTDASTVLIAKSDDAADKLGITFGANDYWEQPFVIGLLFDKMAAGICPYKRKVTGKYVAVGDFFNEFYHNLLNCLLDAGYPVVAFVVD